MPTQAPAKYFQSYLSDGVYVHLDEGNQIWLTAERDGREHAIALEPQVMRQLEWWLADVKKKLQEMQQEQLRGQES